MGLIGRRDRVLILGLTGGLSVVFARPISHLLDVARQNEESYGLALIPGLIILTMVFLLHQQNKRQEIKAEAVAAAAAAQEAESRAHDLERLIAFGQALARSLDLDSIHDVLLQHLSQLAGTADKRFALRVLIRTRRFADKHDLGVRITDAKNGLRARAREIWTFGANRDARLDCRQLVDLIASWRIFDARPP